MRLLPIAMTTLTTIGGLLPLALAVRTAVGGHGLADDLRADRRNGADADRGAIAVRDFRRDLPAKPIPALLARSDGRSSSIGGVQVRIGVRRRNGKKKR